MVQGFWFRIYGLDLGLIHGLDSREAPGFPPEGRGLRIYGVWSMIYGLWFMVWGLESRVHGVGFGV